MPVKKESINANVGLTFLKAANNGIKLTQAKNQKSYFGNDSIRNRPDKIANKILLINMNKPLLPDNRGLTYSALI